MAMAWWLTQIPMTTLILTHPFQECLLYMIASVNIQNIGKEQYSRNDEECNYCSVAQILCVEGMRLIVL